MKVLVTGATGFLGGEVCRALLGRGDAVVATGRKAAPLEALSAAGADTVPHDLTSDDAPDVGKVDALVHCAALSSPWGRYRDFHAANVVGTRHALDLARRASAARFVHISTPGVYFKLADQFDVDEDADLPNPVNAYAATKRLAEQDVTAASDLDPVILRPRGFYGPGDTALLPRLLNAARKRPLPLLNKGRAVTNLTWIGDVASAVLAALDAPPQPSRRIFNIAGDEALNVKDMAEAVCVRAGVPVRFRPVPTAAALAYARLTEWACRLHPRRPEPAVTVYSAGLFAYSQTLDISAAREALGWTPRTVFADGLAQTFAPVS